jgi:dTDP-4-amino-4,6-dideoxygalactose transaminase
LNIIPPLDLGRQYQALEAEINAAVLSVLASSQYIGGPVVAAFEQSFADWIGTPYCISCNSGTDALYLALRAFEVGPGDEVITSPFSFIATAEVISMVGATPIFVDLEPHSFNLDPQQIERAITPRTRAIIPVHLFGRPAQMDKILAMAETHNLPVIEDCAQATGATWPADSLEKSPLKRVGSLGAVGCFSFYPSKNLGGCGDGGAVTTHSATLAQTMRTIRDHGRHSGYVHEMVGMNSRLDSIQAAILNVKLPHLTQWNQRRQAVAHRYSELLGEIDEITVPSSSDHSVWNQYTIRIRHEGEPSDSVSDLETRRDRVRTELQAQGIQSMVYYPLPLHRQPVYAHLNYRLGQLPEVDQAAMEVLSLPMFPELTEAEQERIRDGLKDALSRV